MFGERQFPYPAFIQRPSTPPFEPSYLDGALDQVSLDWPFSTYLQARADDMPLHQPQTRVNSEFSKIQHRNIRARGTSITPPSTDEEKKEGSLNGRREKKKSSIKKEQEAWSKNTGEMPTKQVRRRNRRSRKRKEVDPTSLVEVEKRSKFLERNRVAASKCRQKKKEWASNLDEKARELQVNKESLSALVNSLKEEVLFLKGEMLKHSTCSCPQIKSYLQSQIGDISKRAGRCSHCYHEPTTGDTLLRSRRSSDNYPSLEDDDDQSSMAGTASVSMSPRVLGYQYSATPREEARGFAVEQP